MTTPKPDLAEPRNAKMRNKQRESWTLNLRPCPFCGASPMRVSNFETGFWVECPVTNCWVSGPQRKTSSAAIAAWNRRKALRDGLEDMREHAAKKVERLLSTPTPRLNYPDAIRALTLDPKEAQDAE